MRCALAPRADLGARALVSGPPHSQLRRASQAIEEATGKIYNGKGKDGKKIDKGAAAQSKPLPPPRFLHSSGRPRRLRHLWARLALLAWPTLPAALTRPPAIAPPPRALGLAAPNGAGATAVEPAGR